MKRILLSLGMIVFVAAAAAGATGAFFSDEETSTGNVFAAGALDLQIDNTSYGFDWNNPNATSTATGVWGLNEAHSWELGDLDNCGLQNNEPCLFFNFHDLKPGDYGEDTISLHVDNDAWACVALNLTQTPDNGINGPEEDAGDVTDGVDGGELQNYLSFLFWRDDGDNVYEDDEELIDEFTGLPGEVFTGEWLALAQGGDDPDLPIPGGETGYIGKGWCFGEMTPTPVEQDGQNDNPPSAPDRVGFTCNGEGDHNIAQTDGITVDVHFYGVQSRNNGDFLCSSLPPVGEEEVRETVGAALGDFTPLALDDAQCDVTVDDTDLEAEFTSIQAAIDDGGTVNGDTICVGPGIYDEDVLVNKEVTLTGDGATATSVINGVGVGESAAVRIAADNVTVRGFEINGAGKGAIRFAANIDGATIEYNRLNSASGQLALDTEGGQSNHMISNNEFVGDASTQIVYVNGTASVANASSNVDFVDNTFLGSIAVGGVALGNESTGSNMTHNSFADTLTSTYAILETWEDDALINFNNFHGVGGIKVRNGDAGTVNAEDNWWGAAIPAGHTSGDVDDDPKEASAFPEN